jgi:hypothetical protein
MTQTTQPDGALSKTDKAIMKDITGACESKTIADEEKIEWVYDRFSGRREMFIDPIEIYNDFRKLGSW